MIFINSRKIDKRIKNVAPPRLADGRFFSVNRTYFSTKGI